MAPVTCGLGRNDEDLDIESMPIASLPLAFLCGYALSLLFFLARKKVPRRRMALCVITTALTLLAPLLIPVRFPVSRCLVATTLVFFIMKSCEVHRHPDKYAKVSLLRYAPFLMNHCLVVPRRTDHFRNGLPLANRVRHFVVRTLYISIATAALYGVFQLDWSRHAFWSEHFVKSAAAFAWIDCAFPWYGAFWVLAGVRTIEFNDRLLLAYTPAQFWRRYHRPAHEWLHENVFKPLRIFTRPGAALLLTFVVSGLIHEYIIAVSLSRPTGHMLGFFTLQGLVSLITARLHPTGARQIAGLVLTYTFLLASSVYFFAPVDQGIAFYTNEIPAWLSPW
jgi:hypothetical protein